MKLTFDEWLFNNKEKIVDLYNKETDPDYEIKKADVPDRIRKAFENGEWLQYRQKDGRYWTSFNKFTACDGFDFDTEHCEYRLKVEEYVPFETLDELIAAWEEKVPGNKNRNKDLTLPIIWFKSNEFPGWKRMITDFDFDDNTVYSGEDEYTLIQLFDRYRFLDDSIIGKIKEQ